MHRKFTNEVCMFRHNVTNVYMYVCVLYVMQMFVYTVCMYYVC